MARQYEEAEQIAVFTWARYQECVHPELKWLFHVPNGGARDRVTGAKLKAAGVKPGVPDICLPVARGGYHGLYIELKYGKNTTSESQKEWLTHLEAAGYKAQVCYGRDEAVQAIKDYLEVVS